jgi:hypothetical protein
VMSTAFPPTRHSSSSWVASRTLHRCKEILRTSRERKGALFARALALAYLESVGGVVSPDRNEFSMGVQFAELTSWSCSTGRCNSDPEREFVQSETEADSAVKICRRIAPKAIISAAPPPKQTAFKGRGVGPGDLEDL